MTVRHADTTSATVGSTATSGPVLVGVDWSQNARHAARWAAVIAGSTDRTVIALHASSPWVGLEMALPAFDYGLYRQAIDDGIQEWTRPFEGIEHEAVVIEDDPARALLFEQAKVGAECLVVGAHAGGNWTPPMLGSVTSKVLHASASPVAVVPASAALEPPTADVVVGVDGSASSLRALRWAADWAARIGVGVYALCAYPMEAYFEKPRLADWDSDDPASDTLAALRQLASQVSAEFDVDVSSDVVVGHPAEQLIESACDRTALVVGRTGHGSFAEVVFGSTSRTCATHSEVPVVVVP